MEYRPTNPPSFYEDEEQTELCCICYKEIKPFNTKIVNDLGKAVIVCNKHFNLYFNENDLK